jgi:hypothetical protein
MTAPIDVTCSTCQSLPGNYCTSATIDPNIRARVTFHHADRVDAAARETDQRWRHDPARLRAALREAIAGWAARDHEGHDADDRKRIRAEFNL